MITIDKRLSAEEIAILQSLIGKRIISFRHDPLNVTSASSQVVGIDTELGDFYLYSFPEPLDYYGAIEDVAIWELTHERYPFVDQKKLVSSFVNEEVREIRVVQENQRLFKDGEQIYNVWVTRGLIFDFTARQYSLEKPIWFSDDIYIQNGHELISKFISADKFVNDDWEDGCVAQCDREIMVIQ